jgi:hypothetical protein
VSRTNDGEWLSIVSTEPEDAKSDFSRAKMKVATVRREMKILRLRLMFLAD